MTNITKDDGIKCRLMKCTKLKRLQLLVGWYTDDEYEKLNVDDFFHLVSCHQDQFDSIYELFGGQCNTTKCNFFRRNCSQRHMEKQQKRYTARQQIICNIHCYYRHYFDINYKLSTNEKETMKHMQSVNQLIDEKTKLNVLRNRFNKKYNHYSFGFKFKYGYDGEELRGYSEYICVTAKYATLKEELTSNPIATLSMEQFSHEYNKALIYFSSQYCKKRFLVQNKWLFLVEYIISLMVYCNFTELQYLFSKTYRENNGGDHPNFYHLGKNLKISVKQFGKRIADHHVNAFYHGIGEQFVFSRYIDCVQIYGPLSTTSSFEVATTFTNYNNGLIVQFGDVNCDWGESTKCLSVSWLSDYGNELEYLFIQSENSERLTINNIVDARSGQHYGVILKALNIIHQATYSYLTKQRVDSNMKNLIIKIFYNYQHMRMHKTFQCFNEYGMELINTYFKNKTFMRLDYTEMKHSQYCFLLKIFFPQEECAHVQ
eukprot:260859_1